MTNNMVSLMNIKLLAMRAVSLVVVVVQAPSKFSVLVFAAAVVVLYINCKLAGWAFSRTLVDSRK